MDAPEDANILASERQGPIGLVVCQAGPPGVGVRPVQSAAERSTLRCRGRPAIHSPTPRSDIVPARFVHEVLRHGFEASKTLASWSRAVAPLETPGFWAGTLPAMQPTTSPVPYRRTITRCLPASQGATSAGLRPVARRIAVLRPATPRDVLNDDLC
jgi:hypothetical protein